MNTAQAIRARTAEIVAQSSVVNRAAADFVATRLRTVEGKRNNAADAATIQLMHDTAHTTHANACALGATCPDAAAADEDDNDEPEAKNLAAFLPPDPYALATARAAAVREVLDPTTDDAYESKGMPPNSYAIALALRRVRAAEATSTTAARPMPVVRNASGIPDGYLTALARRKQDTNGTH